MNRERGGINLGNMILMGIGMIMMAVGFIIYPIVVTATATILNYSYAANASINTAYFTGLTAITGIVPLLTLVGFVTAGAITGFMGIKLSKEGGSANLDMGNLIMLGIGLIFIAIGLIIYPITLDGIASVLDTAGISQYTGLVPILRVTPIIVLVAFVSAGVITGFFGIKGISAA